MRFMLNWLLTSIAIAIATFLVPGIQPFGMADAWVCFAFVGLFLNIVDSLVKPFLTVISLPLTIITLGIFQLVVNSFMLELASYLSVNLLGAGISIAKLLLQFGAGNIGRGFIGAVLSEAGYHVVFADVNMEVIDRINKDGAYTVHITKMGGLLICQVSKGERICHFHPVPKWQVG